MNRFLTQLPVVIASFFLALIKAITDPLKWFGWFYYHIETAILGTLADRILIVAVAHLNRKPDYGLNRIEEKHRA